MDKQEIFEMVIQEMRKHTLERCREPKTVWSC